MFANDNGTRRPSTITRSWMVLVSLGLCLFMSVAAYAQNNFNSGSTGADGAFAPATTQTIVVPDSGVFNFTTVNIPAGVPSLSIEAQTTSRSQYWQAAT